MEDKISKAKKFYNNIKHKDDWGVDVIYPKHVDDVIDISYIEGVLVGLKICKDMLNKTHPTDLGHQLDDNSIYENEVYYNELLSNKMSSIIEDDKK